MGILIEVLRSRRSTTGLFLKTLSRCKCTGVDIFSVSGVWERELSVDILKRIESHWNSRVNEYRPPVTTESSRCTYILSMFPYPSGKLHMGHVRVYTLSDIIARFYRMKGKKVIHPIGWDAFGLPAENAAIEKGAQPAQWTKSNIAVMKKQLLEFGYSFDWDREFSTCDPHYYKWTQFLFLQLFHQGYAYRKQADVNWDPVDQTVLADEQVDENGCSWRSGAKVEKKCLKQWFVRTSAFSKALYDGLNDPVLTGWKDVIYMQRHWIGDCNGHVMDFKLVCDGKYLNESLSVWTDRPELLYGVTFLTVASNHFLNAARESHDSKINVSAVHPFTKALIPIYVDDTADISNSTNSRVGIPCVNSEDKTFAEKHNLSVSNVIQQEKDGVDILCNSEEFSGLSVTEARPKVLKKIKDLDVLCYPSSRNLRDWLISRQRYWGTPIPIIHCEDCGIVPVPFNDLPVVLPNVAIFGKGGLSLLASANDWVNTECPKCGKNARRETDTMDTFVDSSWYYLRYLDSNNDKVPFDPISVRNAMPVDLYIGGKEHAVMHLYYARFMSHFCHSLGYLKHPEPFSKLLVQGLVTAESYRLPNSGRYIRKDEVDFSGRVPVAKKSGESIVVQWEKMSKSKYNGVEAEDMLAEYGVDVLRICMMAYYSPHSQRKWILSDFEPIIKWKKTLWQTIKEFRQLKEKSYDTKPISEEEWSKHKTLLCNNRNLFVKEITYQLEDRNDLRDVINKLKTMTSSLRNTPKSMWGDCPEFERMLATLIIMLSPITPHFASELWVGFTTLAKPDSNYDVTLPVLCQTWPKFDDDFSPEPIVKSPKTTNKKTVKQGPRTILS